MSLIYLSWGGLNMSDFDDEEIDNDSLNGVENNKSKKS